MLKGSLIRPVPLHRNCCDHPPPVPRFVAYRTQLCASSAPIYRPTKRTPSTLALG